MSLSRLVTIAALPVPEQLTWYIVELPLERLDATCIRLESQLDAVKAEMRSLATMSYAVNEGRPSEAKSTIELQTPEKVILLEMAESDEPHFDRTPKFARESLQSAQSPQLLPDRIALQVDAAKSIVSEN